MAKGNLLLGMGRGKLGDIVLYRQNGQQMSRPRTRVVKNPRTSGQQIQRMIQATIAYGYAGLKTIVDHSFEGVQYGQRSMSYFMKRNMDELRAKVIAGSNGANIDARFAIPNVRVIYPNAYVVSNGSLTPFPDVVSFQDETGILDFGLETVEAPTVEQFMNALGCSAGDQLTFLVLNVNKQNVVASLNGETAYATALAVRRWKFKDTISAESLAKPYNAATDEYVDREVTSSDLDWILAPAAEGASPKFVVEIPTLSETVSYVGACCIRSRRQGQSWLRSPQTMTLNTAVIKDAENPMGFSLATAYNAWMSGTTPVGVSEYILNGKPNTDVWPSVPDEGDDEPEP
jgi:hypothetical protein